MILFNNRLPGQVAYRNDMVGIVHAVLFDAVHIGIYIAATSVVVGGMYVYDERLAAYRLGMKSRRIRQPVVGMDNIELFGTGYHSGYNGIVVYFLQKVIGVTP
ncbi:hypothetical protein Barb4_03495 [Bacteroidales bacterium Barb4]|nr:hypothetical protein Barb4_03495 [Bacteroidales bacterium Barb4]